MRLLKEIAANAEETASASEELAAQAETTMDQVMNIVSTGRWEYADGISQNAKKTSNTKSFNNVKGIGSGNGNGSYMTLSLLAKDPEALIPMGENRVDEYSESMKDF